MLITDGQPLYENMSDSSELFSECELGTAGFRPILISSRSRSRSRSRERDPPSPVVKVEPFTPFTGVPALVRTQPRLFTAIDVSDDEGTTQGYPPVRTPPDEPTVDIADCTREVTDKRAFCWKVKRIFVTLDDRPEDMTKEQVLLLAKSIPQYHASIICREQHPQTGGWHFHLMVWFNRNFRERGRDAFNKYFQHDDTNRSVYTKFIWREPTLVKYLVKDGDVLCDNTTVEERTNLRGSKTSLTVQLAELVQSGKSMDDIVLSEQAKRGWRWLRPLREYHTHYNAAQAASAATTLYAPLLVPDDDWCATIATWCNRNFAPGYEMPLRTDYLAEDAHKRHLWIWVRSVTAINYCNQPFAASFAIA